MSPESYILLMISGWLLVSAAMLWGMLRLLNRYQLEAQLAEEFPALPASPSDPVWRCLLYTSPSPRDRQKSRMPSSA